MIPALVLLVCVTFVSGADLYVQIDSLSGRAEVQRAGRHQWQAVTKQMKLMNNDIIHVLPTGYVTLKWPDGSVSYIHQNSQMLINFIQNSGTENRLLNHSTVFFGAVFFLVRKIAPRGLFSETTMRVYTPTAVISIRGTAFEVAVDEKNGATGVRVISGTVEVRNILRGVSLFLGSPFQTTVTMNSDPTPSKLVIQTDLDAMKTWVPAAVISSAIERHLSQALKESATIASKLEDKVIITLFDNTSSYTGPWPIAATLTKAITERLRKIRPGLTFIIKDSVTYDPFMLARKNNARFALVGTIEQFDVSQHAEVSAKADEYREYALATVNLRLRLLDAATGKQLAEETYAGDATSKNVGENSWQKINALKFDPADTVFAKTILGTALNQALGQATDKIWQYIEE
jgi:hypothetical protein